MKISMLNFGGYAALAAAISLSAVSCIGSLGDMQVHDGSSVTIKAECLDMLPQFHDPLSPARLPGIGRFSSREGSNIKGRTMYLLVMGYIR